MAWIRHGHRRPGNTSPTWVSWISMIGRTSNPNAADYSRYGGRGIKVCERWRRSFAAFLEDMGERPPGTTLDRFPNNDGDYEPGNCRWATRLEQDRNKRSNVLVSFHGKTQCISAWAEEVGLSRKQLEQRLRAGMSPEAALTTPTLSRAERARLAGQSRQAKVAAGMAQPRKTPARKKNCIWGHELNPKGRCPTCNRLRMATHRAKAKAL